MLKDADRAAAGKEDKANYPRLLAVDNEVVVPVNTTVRVLVTAADVIHAFAMPAFGVKTDAVPGRINEIWFKARQGRPVLRPVLRALRQGPCLSCRSPSASCREEQYDTWLTAAGTDLPGANKALMAAIDGEPSVAVAGN